jgi:anti-sigma factor NepR-like protein
MPDKTAGRARKRAAGPLASDATSPSAAMDRYIADQLRAIYDAVTAEPIPDQLLELLDRLDGDGESEGSRAG